MKAAGFTRTELIVVIALVAVLLLGFVIPSFNRTQTKVAKIKCASNLKNVSLAFRLFAVENDTKFPMAISTNEGGSLEFVNGPKSIYRHFLAMSNELSTPKILICPDAPFEQTVEAMSWNAAEQLPYGSRHKPVPFDGNDHTSYFVGLNAKEGPGWILSGDNNLMTEDRPNPRTSWMSTVPSGQEISAYGKIRWADERHHGKGNVAFGDGRVEGMTAEEMRQRLKDAPEDTALGIQGNPKLKPLIILLYDRPRCAFVTTGRYHNTIASFERSATSKKHSDAIFAEENHPSNDHASKSARPMFARPIKRTRKTERRVFPYCGLRPLGCPGAWPGHLA